MYGTRLVYLADEFYIMAEKLIPDYDDYEGFPQIENGVGLYSSLKYEFCEALEQNEKCEPKKKKTIATGKIAYGLLKELSQMIPGDKIEVVAIENNFFGEDITVSGLICGCDLINQLKDRDLGEELLLSQAMFRHNEEIFQDSVAKFHLTYPFYA